MGNKRPSFSLHDFKKWMQGQDDGQGLKNTSSKNLGLHVEAAVSSKKLMSKAIIEEGDAHRVIRDFCRNGGTVLKDDGQYYVVEVMSGKFAVPKSVVTA